MADAVLDLPPVRGRHRNRTLAKARQNRCVQLAAQCWTYEAIKDELGYASRSTAWRRGGLLSAPQRELRCSSVRTGRQPSCSWHRSRRR